MSTWACLPRINNTRSVPGDVMNKKKKSRRYVQLDYDLMDSVAFKELSAHQIRVLLKFMQKRKWSTLKKGRDKKTIYDDGGLVLTYGEAEIMGIKKSSFHKAVKKLVELGFIDVEHYGGWLGRDYSRYAISNRWKYYVAPDIGVLA